LIIKNLEVKIYVL